MESLDYIDSYFKGELDPAEKGRIEERIVNDPAFAEEMAHYLLIFQVAREQAEADKKKRFLELYQQNKTGRAPALIRRIWPSIAVAALVAGIIFGWYLFMQPVSASKLADQYMHEHLQSLPVTMGTNDNSMQTALKLYNDGKLIAALQHFQDIIQSDTSNSDALKWAGITSLRLQHYDKALQYFEQLQTHQELFTNPALLYQALTLMKRNGPGDALQAKRLLQLLVQDDMEGKEIAREWLKKL